MNNICALESVLSRFVFIRSKTDYKSMICVLAILKKYIYKNFSHSLAYTHLFKNRKRKKENKSKLLAIIIIKKT